ncbi:ureidoglycolate lyase [Pseudooceanicola antarcticus]|uniref:Ureidoglycolate lyase n=1 Tax=Pseudooceanicola antarcticus TaxID=1247613 RepID=A0A285HLC9_9RHOB|nr:ureidoglycolate lyase [Pseudooceanicola antarcticus]PJE27972.1 hypothetical protein CVM39_15560 [Pseudooceanicola antarcticus]SNY35576.1 ureidoglycolate lyase [Pseudooceanicola antarcticus]
MTGTGRPARRLSNEQVIVLQDPDDAAFAPFGEFVKPPAVSERRAFYSAHFDPRPETAAPVVHVNRVAPSVLPLVCAGVERHPHAAQCFVPMDVSRYVVMVMPSDENGDPVPAAAQGFLVPGNRGVIFRPMVWHMGACVLDRDGNFVVMMWRGGPGADDEFRSIPPVTLMEPGA